MGNADEPCACPILMQMLNPLVRHVNAAKAPKTPDNREYRELPPWRKRVSDTALGLLGRRAKL